MPLIFLALSIGLTIGAILSREDVRDDYQGVEHGIATLTAAASDRQARHEPTSRPVREPRYSYRSACVGGIRVALRAGSQAASSVARNIDGTTIR